MTFFAPSLIKVMLMASFSDNLNTRPLHPNFFATPPSPPVDPNIDPEKLKLLSYEKQLLHQQTILSMLQKYLETKVIRLRIIKKALNAKQRQLRKNGSELTENDSVELARVSQEQAGLQKQLDQVVSLLMCYNNKQNLLFYFSLCS